MFKVFSLNGLSVFFKIIIGFITSKIIAVYVGTSGMALVGNFRNFINIFESVGLLGFQNGIIKYVAENEDFHERLEELELSWADDFHISNSMIQKTIGFMKQNQPSHTLIKMLKDEEDRHFAKKLLLQSISHWENSEKKIEERLENWDLERISLMDRLILITAITEIDNFPLTPAKVIINEYIEVSKVFATDRSQIFVNGILDKYTKDISRA